MAVARICMEGEGIGCGVDIGMMPGCPAGGPAALFSESHSRYLAVVPAGSAGEARRFLADSGVPHAMVGTFGGGSVSFRAGSTTLADIMVDKARREWSGALERMIRNG